MRLDHLSEQEMNVLSKKGVFDGKKLRVLPFCEDYVYGKYKRVSFKLIVHNTKGILNYSFGCLGSFKRRVSLGKCNYLLTFIDDYS